MKDLVRRLLDAGRFSPAAPFQRFAYVCSALLLVSAAVHGVVYLVEGGSWQGPVSWRKPILFGFSFGVTLATIAWFMTFLRPHRIAGWIVLAVLSLASMGEVFLISMQKWRGVASHFNESTPLNESVFSTMGKLVLIIAVVTLLVTVRSFFKIDAPASLALAIRAGLVLMLVSQAVGVHMITIGGNTFGAAGAMKVPHAFTLHTIQVLPALALLLLISDSAERFRIRVVAVGAIGYAGLILSTMLQTYGGRGPLDLNPVSAATALIGLGMLLTSGLLALRRALTLQVRGPTVVAPADPATDA